MATFDTWLLRRVARAVEDGEMSAALLTERWAELEAARAQTQEEGHP